MPFFSSGEGAGTNSLSSVFGASNEIVRVTTIDQFLESRALEAVSMIKIDAEGFDCLVLGGARRTLTTGTAEVIQFEYNWRWLVNNRSLRDVFELIAGTPYSLNKLLPASLECYSQWHPELDRFFEANYALIRTDSALNRLAAVVRFNNSNVPVAQTV
jgi:hypothetical protein